MATSARSSISSLTINTDAPQYFRYGTHCEDTLKRLRGRQDLCDVVLIVGDSGKRISAHRLILIASTDYFSALLSGPMRESLEREIILHEVDGDALEKLVNYCYTGRLELRVETIESLLNTANYLQLEKVVEGCCEFLQSHLQPSNCLSVTFLAEQLNLEELLVIAKKFICEHFKEVSNHRDFVLLTAKQLTEFLASNKLNVPSEEFVFRVLRKWIEYEPENRSKHFTELLAQVRLPLLSPTFLAKEVEPLCYTVESHKLFVNALNSHLLHTSNSTELMNYRSKSPAKHLLGIYTENQNLAIGGYNVQANVWTKWKTPISCRKFAAALMNDNLILVGGSLNDSPLNTVTSVNLRTMASTEMVPLITHRSEHCVAILNGLIYAMGGYDGRQALNSVERWDPVSGTWSSVAPMKNFRLSSAVAVIKDHLYVSGGYNSMRAYDASVECYDPIENTWRYTAPMKVKRMLHCIAAHNSYLFAIGGYNAVYKDEGIPIERYDPRTEMWTTIPSSPAIYGFTRCASCGPDLYIINKSNIYTISIEGSCDNLKLQILAKNTIQYISPSEWVAIPYELRPPRNWIKWT